MKMVVSIVLNNFKNDSRVLKEAISLQNGGYDIRVIAIHEEPLREFDTISNIPVHRIKVKSKEWSKRKFIQLIKYFEFIYRTVKEYRDVDIFHCNDLNTLPIGVIVKKFFNKNAKIVYDAHEYETEIFGLKGIQKKVIKSLEKTFIKYVDKTITVSDRIAKEYVRLYNIEKPSLVLNTPSYKEIEKKNIFRKVFGIGKEQTIFLYQGSISGGRGIEILLETFKKLSKENRNIVIVFIGYGEFSNLVQEASERYQNIYFHEAVSPQVLLKYTSSADFGISTIEDSCLSYRYCLPNKMFEYIMAEIPLIVSNLDEMRNLVESNGIGIVAQDNTSNGLKEAIKEAIGLDKEKLKKNIQNLKRVYNWEEQEKILLQLYRELY